MADSRTSGSGPHDMSLHRGFGSAPSDPRLSYSIGKHVSRKQENNRKIEKIMPLQAIDPSDPFDLPIGEVMGGKKAGRRLVRGRVRPSLPIRLAGSRLAVFPPRKTVPDPKCDPKHVLR